MNDIINRLSQLGFSAYEAKAYVALLRKHPAIGYEVSKIARIPTAKIYETLTSLKNKGAILASATEPVLYCPVDPDVLLGRIQAEFEEDIKSLGGLLSKVTPVPSVELTWNLTGYQSVTEKMRGVIQAASKDLLVSVWPEDADAVRAQLLQAERRGVLVIAGVFGECAPVCARTVNLEACGKSAKKRIGKRLNVVAADSAEVVISEMDGEEDTFGIWTTTKSVILTAKEYIRHDIWGRALIDALGEERFDTLCRTNEILSYLLQNR